MKTINWLPALEKFADYGGNWEYFLEVIYKIYKKDFIDDKLVFEGRKLAVKRHPMYDDKEATFWHIISDGKQEDDRIPNLRRCEYIRWPRPIIEYVGDENLKIWENKRRGETRVCILLDAENYLVVLARRNGYTLFWTAYPVEYKHTKRKLLKEYEAYLKANAA